MGFIKSIAGLVSSRAFVEDKIDFIRANFERSRMREPHLRAHEHLTVAWRMFFSTPGFSEAIRSEPLAKTMGYLFSAAGIGYCDTAMALQIALIIDPKKFYAERSKVIEFFRLAPFACSRGYKYWESILPQIAETNRLNPTPELLQEVKRSCVACNEWAAATMGLAPSWPGDPAPHFLAAFNAYTMQEVIYEIWKTDDIEAVERFLRSQGL